MAITVTEAVPEREGLGGGTKRPIIIPSIVFCRTRPLHHIRIDAECNTERLRAAQEAAFKSQRPLRVQSVAPHRPLQLLPIGASLYLRLMWPV